MVKLHSLGGKGITSSRGSARKPILSTAEGTPLNALIFLEKPGGHGWD